MIALGSGILTGDNALLGYDVAKKAGFEPAFFLRTSSLLDLTLLQSEFYKVKFPPFRPGSAGGSNASKTKLPVRVSGAICTVGRSQ
jgi:hypothetical protein